MYYFRNEDGDYKAESREEAEIFSASLIGQRPEHYTDNQWNNRIERYAIKQNWLDKIMTFVTSWR